LLGEKEKEKEKKKKGEEKNIKNIIYAVSADTPFRLVEEYLTRVSWLLRAST